MSDPEYVFVRRPAGEPFGVMPDDLIAEPPTGYDLSLMQSITNEGLVSPITVQPLSHGRFKVTDGQKRLAAIRILIRLNKMVYDNVSRILRPAKQVFAVLRCRVRGRPQANNREHDIARETG
jgi:ParB-like nuclease domain